MRNYRAQASGGVIRVSKSYPVIVLNEMEELFEKVKHISLDTANPDYTEYRFDYEYGEFDADRFFPALDVLNSAPGILYGNVTFAARGEAYGVQVFHYIYDSVEGCWKDEEMFVPYPPGTQESRLTFPGKKGMLKRFAEILESWLNEKNGGIAGEFGGDASRLQDAINKTLTEYGALEKSVP